MSMKQPQLPGNFGGETLRQYCGLRSPRRTRRRGYKGKRFIDGPITTQDLYRAIRRHQQGQEGE